MNRKLTIIILWISSLNAWAQYGSGSTSNSCGTFFKGGPTQVCTGSTATYWANPSKVGSKCRVGAVSGTYNSVGSNGTINWGSQTGWYEVDFQCDCGTNTYTRVEVIAGGDVRGGVVSASESTVCSGAPVTLSLSNFSNRVLYWQKKPFGGSWKTINPSNDRPSINDSPTNFTSYRARVTNTCSGDQAWSSIASVNITQFKPGIFLMGGGIECSNTAISLELSSSEEGAYYSLYRNGNQVGFELPGGGSRIAWDNLREEGTYTVKARKGQCYSGIGSGAQVSYAEQPIAYSLTGGGEVCATGGGVSIRLSGSESEVSYQLRLLTSRGSLPVRTVMGTGKPLNFSAREVGTYYVVATRTTSGVDCSRSTNGVSVTLKPTPPPLR